MGNNSLLRYYKTILEKVSFDSRLVAKEYRKAKQLLQNEEAQELDNWMKSTGLIQKLSAGPSGSFKFPVQDNSSRYLIGQE
jgi:hypothetical protein